MIKNHEKLRKTTLFAATLVVTALVVAVPLSGLLTSCASIGHPEGGPRDEVPPVYVKSDPMPGATNVSKSNLEIVFDENIKLDDASNKVVVSPAQKNMPQISSNGKHLTVELRDTLQPETTYTIDFSDAIQDLNEGNILDGFALEFSTGEAIDSLRISGMLFQARNLEPAQGMVVGCYSNLSDTALTTVPMQRIAKTNQYGQFTIRGLKEGTYRIFAVNDVNRDYMWDRSEDVAFYDVTLSPTVEQIEVTDTLLNSAGTDSIASRKGVKYLPNDVLLTWFNEGYKSQYLKNYSRTDSSRIFIQFAAKTDTLPTLEIVSGKNAGKKIDRSNSILNTRLDLDSLDYWITDPEIISQDSMLIALTYLRTDTLDNLTWTTDTLKFNYLRRDKEKKEKKKKKDEEADSIPEITFIDFKCDSPAQQELNKGLEFSCSEPILRFDEGGLHLEVQRDSIWTPMTLPPLQNDTIYSPLKFKVAIPWEEGTKYRFTADSASIHGIYGKFNKPIKHEFQTKSLEDYATITFVIPQEAGNFVVELLNGSDQPIRQIPVTDGVAVFDYITPGKYYARGFIDANGNGIWDTGNVSQKIQPEEVYYYPKKIELKKNWEVEQAWNPFEMPLDLQKPNDIKKNKPKKKKGEQEKPAEEEEEEDEWGDSYYNPNAPGYNNNSNSGGFKSTGGFSKSGQTYR